MLQGNVKTQEVAFFDEKSNAMQTSIRVCSNCEKLENDCGKYHFVLRFVRAKSCLNSRKSVSNLEVKLVCQVEGNKKFRVSVGICMGQ